MVVAVSAQGAAAQFHACDVADAAAVQHCADAVVRDLGEPTALVTSAALIPNTESVLDMDLAAHDRLWRVNHHGTVHACRSFGACAQAARATS